MVHKAVLAALMLAPLVGCVRQISSDDRLERDLASIPIKQAISAEELKGISCADAAAALASVRAENKPEADRVHAYMELYESLKKKTATFEEAMTRNPDLHYQEGSQPFVEAHAVCVQEMSDVRLEFEHFTRDLVEMPTMQELKGGDTVVVARLNFNTLRQAIESLDPDDKEALLARLSMAEKKIAEGKEEKPRRKR